jgi:hypothetical protein
VPVKRRRFLTEALLAAPKKREHSRKHPERENQVARGTEESREEADTGHVRKRSARKNQKPQSATPD